VWFWNNRQNRRVAFGPNGEVCPLGKVFGGSKEAVEAPASAVSAARSPRSDHQSERPRGASNARGAAAGHRYFGDRNVNVSSRRSVVESGRRVPGAMA